MKLPASRELSKSRPLLGLAAAAAAGICIADLLPRTWPFWPVIGPCLAVSVACLWVFRHWLGWTPLLLTMGLITHTHRLDVSRDHPWHEWLKKQNQPAWVEVTGVVEQPLRRNLPGFAEGEGLFKIQHLEVPGQPQIWQERSLAPSYSALRLTNHDTLKSGRYRLNGWMKLAAEADNPGQFNKRIHDLRLGLIGQIEVAHILDAEPYAWDFRSALVEVSEKCRNWIASALSQYLPEECPESVVLLAMTLGTSDTATPEMQLPFRLSGTLHIFAVSGLHVAIIGMIFWFLLRCAGISRGKQPLLLIPILFVYTFLTGMPPSAMRSAFMASILLLGMMSNRRSDLLNSLGAAALLLLFFDTNQLFQAGFQLSFGVLSAIALFAQLIRKPLLTWEEPDPFLPKSLLTFRQQAGWWFRKSFAGTVCVSAAAWIGSLPLMWYHFHTLTPIGLVANLILVPWSFVVLSLSITRVILASIALPLLQQGFAWLSYQAAAFTLWAAQCFASVPYGHVYVPSLNQFPRPDVQLTVLRMSGADGANHLRIGNTHWLLDGGSLRQFPFVLQPYLHHQGINRIHHLLISHSDIAHHGSASLLASHYGLKHISAPYEIPKKFPLEGIQWNLVHAPHKLDIPSSAHPKIHLDILFPPKPWQSQKSDDRTLLARLSVGKHRVLWCNDAGFAAEKYLLEHVSAQDLKCDILIRNQHASDHSMLPEFLLAVSPRAIISSHSQFPIEQQIHPSLRQQCLRQGILLYDQSQSGAISLRFWPDKLQAVPFHQSSPILTLLTQEPSAL